MVPLLQSSQLPVTVGTSRAACVTYACIPRLDVSNEGISLSILNMFFSISFPPALLFESNERSGSRGARDHPRCPAHWGSKVRPQELAAILASQV